MADCVLLKRTGQLYQEYSEMDSFWALTLRRKSVPYTEVIFIHDLVSVTKTLARCMKFGIGIL